MERLNGQDDKIRAILIKGDQVRVARGEGRWCCCLPLLLSSLWLVVHVVFALVLACCCCCCCRRGCCHRVRDMFI